MHLPVKVVLDVKTQKAIYNFALTLMIGLLLRALEGFTNRDN